MIFFKKSILALFFFAVQYATQAQSPQLDSINLLIEKVDTDTARINLLLKKAKIFNNINLDSTIVLYNRVLNEASTFHYRKGTLEALKYLSSSYAKKADSLNAQKNLSLLKKLVQSSTDSVEIGEMYGRYGYVYCIQGRNDEAIPLLLKAVSIIERHGGSNSLSEYYNGLGISYWQKGNFPEALKYQQANLKLAEKELNVRAQAISLVNIAGIQMNSRDFVRAEQTYKIVIELAQKNSLTDVEVYAYSNLSSLAMDKQDFESAYTFALKAANLGSTLGDQVIQAANFSKAAKSLAELDRFDEAKEYAQQSIDIANIIDHQLISSQAYSSMGTTMLLQKKYQEAIPYFEEALIGVKLNDFSEYISSLFGDLSTCYEKTDNPKKALEAFRKFNMMKDSVRKRENIQKSTELNMNFEFDKKQALSQAEQDVKDAEAKRIKNQQYFTMILLGIVLLTVGVIAFLQYRKKMQKQKTNLLLQKEKQKVETTLTELKVTQAQLIQSEKMASLGELTAGIAHEIQNPLNFVNNFSEVSRELIDEMNEEIEKGALEEAKIIAKDIKQNLEKINHHGKRADAIVKGMLQHSRSSTGTKEPTDINELADEYLRLAYHGLRAKDKSFNATMETDFDESIGLVNVIPQDMGRVILNLITNAFYAVNEKKAAFAKAGKEYTPTVSITTKRDRDLILIVIKDNGNGIPKHVAEKIFQPFFTTKPTGQGTGLGLSMSYDIIIKGHGGELKVETKEKVGTSFIIELPIT